MKLRSKPKKSHSRNHVLVTTNDLKYIGYVNRKRFAPVSTRTN